LFLKLPKRYISNIRERFVLPRETIRKQIIRKILEERYHGGPVLLEELRWESLLTEYEERGSNLIYMTRSLRNSFTRTIREHMPKILIQKLPRPEALHAGIVSRAALYRLNSWKNILFFKYADDPTVFTKWRGNRVDPISKVYCLLFTKYPALTTREGTFRQNKPFYAPNGQLIDNYKYEGYKIRCWDREHLIGCVIFPGSIPLSLITTREVTAADLRKIADVPWKIYRDWKDPPLPEWYPPKLLHSNQSIRSYWKGGYLKNPLTKGPWSKT
jgi:hypothetical protein